MAHSIRTRVVVHTAHLGKAPGLNQPHTMSLSTCVVERSPANKQSGGNRGADASKELKTTARGEGAAHKQSAPRAQSANPPPGSCALGFTNQYAIHTQAYAMQGVCWHGMYTTPAVFTILQHKPPELRPGCTSPTTELTPATLLPLHALQQGSHAEKFVAAPMQL